MLASVQHADGRVGDQGPEGVGVEGLGGGALLLRHGVALGGRMGVP